MASIRIGYPYPQNGDWHSLLNALKIYSRFRVEFPYTPQRLLLMKYQPDGGD
jgi:hypothetical protein